jgi:7-carboxy-7-deazaguanine synthase
MTDKIPLVGPGVPMFEKDINKSPNKSYWGLEEGRDYLPKVNNSVPSQSKVIPINVDRNVSFSDYTHLGTDKLLVSSVFKTIQGEGPYAGHPSVFLRLAGCNIGAKQDCGFCDTKFDFDKGKVRNYVDLAHELVVSSRENSHLIVITGGEPMLQEKALYNLIAYAEAYYSYRLEYQVETNGYFVSGDSFSGLSHKPYIVISPKAIGSKSKYGKFKSGWVEYDGKKCLKYVLTEDKNSPYNKVPDDHLKAARENKIPLYVSGMAVYKKSYPDGRTSSIWNADEIDQEQTAKNYRYCAQYAMDNGLLVSLQTHLFLGVE